jgi:hypothetical protein
MISVKDKVSSFLHHLKQVSLVHQLSLLQREVEMLARQESLLVEIAGKALLLVNYRQEPDGFATAANDLPGDHKRTVV